MMIYSQWRTSFCNLIQTQKCASHTVSHMLKMYLNILFNNNKIDVLWFSFQTMDVSLKRCKLSEIV